MATYMSNGSYASVPCESLTGWTFVTGGAGSGVITQEVYDGEECFKYDTGAAAPGRARNYKDLGTFGETTIFSTRLYHTDLGIQSTYNIFEFEVNVTAESIFRVGFASDGLFIFDGDVWNEVGTNLVTLDTWQDWSFEIDASVPSAATCNIYLGHSLVASGVDCSTTGYVQAGWVAPFLQGYSITNLVSYIDYMIFGDGWVDYSVKWNSADKAADIALTNGDLTASPTVGTAHAGVRGLQKLGQGKWYWEVLVDNLGSSSLMAAGVSFDTYDLISRLGAASDGWSYTPVGRSLHDGTDAIVGSAYGTNSRLSFAVDMYQSKMWVGVDGAWQGGGNPVTGANPTFSGFYDFVFPTWSGYDADDSVTIVFDSADFVYSIPSGYAEVAYDENPTEPTGLIETTLSETAGATDVIQSYLTYSRSIEESVGATDAWQVSNPIYSALAEEAGVSDVFVVTSPIETLLEEDVGATDSFVGYSLSTSISDSAQASDTFVGTVLAGVLAEGVGAIDQWATETVLLIQTEDGRHYVRADVATTETSYTAPLGQIDVALPFFDVDIFGGGSLDVTLPALTVDVVGEVNESAVVDVTLPKLETEVLGGGYLDASLPSFSASISGDIETLSTVDVELPTLLMSSSGKVEGVLTADFTLPALQLTCNGVCEDQISVDVSLYPLQVSITGMNGELGTVEIDLPMLEADITGVPSTDGYGAISLPALLANVHGSAWSLYDDYVMRFVR